MFISTSVFLRWSPFLKWEHIGFPQEKNSFSGGEPLCYWLGAKHFKEIQEAASSLSRLPAADEWRIWNILGNTIDIFVHVKILPEDYQAISRYQPSNIEIKLRAASFNRRVCICTCSSFSMRFSGRRVKGLCNPKIVHKEFTEFSKMKKAQMKQ